MADTYRFQGTLTTYEDGVQLASLAASLTDVEHAESYGPVKQKIANGDSWAVQHTLTTIKAIVAIVTGNVVIRLGGEEVGHQIVVPQGQTEGVLFLSCHETQLAFDNNSGTDAYVKLYMVGD
jgi:hypothetical protein